MAKYSKEQLNSMSELEVKNKILALLSKYECLNDLKSYLVNSSYFEDPASCRYHDSHRGGLAKHSFVLGYFLSRMAEEFGLETHCSLNREDFSYLIGICHDLCKVGSYLSDFRNVKDEKGNWIKVPCYSPNPSWYGLGHGVESVLRFSERISDVSLVAALREPVLFHMGPYDVSDSQKAAFQKVKESNPWVNLTIAADSMAADWLETSVIWK